MTKKADPGPVREEFRDRSRRLALFGILAIILGAASGLLGLAHLVPALLGSRLFGDPQSLLMSALTYGIISAILIWAGIGSLQRRRWVPPMMLIIGWCWLIVGLFCLLLVVGLLDDLYILATSGLEELPPHTAVFVKSFLVGAVTLGGLLLPALFVLVYRDRNILRTCEQHDPTPSWTDSCPRPVLALSTALGLAALLSLPLALKPLFPLFGILLTGWSGALMVLLSAAYFAYLARSSFKLAPSAWWGAFIYLLLFGVSTALTVQQVDLWLLYRELGYVDLPPAAFQGSGAPWRPITLWITLLMTVASLAYMLAIRKYFAPTSRGRALLLLALLLLGGGCAAKPEPLFLPLKERADRIPVVVIPGITGVKLKDEASGQVAWGNLRSLLLPRDGGYDTALSIDPEARSRRKLEPFAPLLSIDLPGPGKKEIYAPLLRLMLKNGYRLDGDLFFFVYDWRRGTVEASSALLRQLEELRQARGESRLRVTIICQSNAALIGRYFVKYGGATIQEAESGITRLPDTIEVTKLILVGTANGGALRVLHEMSRGRRYISLIGRRWLPETLFTFDSLFESLPTYRRDLFFNSAGETLDIDLFDAASWQRYEWSIYGHKAQRRLQRLGEGGPFGDPVLRERRLQEMLDRTVRLHRLLAADVAGVELPRYYSLQNAFSPTAERAMLAQRNGRWRTYFAEDSRLRRDPYLLSLAASPGDGHATLESQDRLSPGEEAALAHPPVYIEGEHFGVINSPATQRWLLQFLSE